jgi:hypothetical protein
MGSSTTEEAQAHPTPDELNEALKVKVYDREGKTITLGELTKGKRSVLIFTRHYCTYTLQSSSPILTSKGCLNCQAYVRAISQSTPPSKLPENTQSTPIPIFSTLSDCDQSSSLATVPTNPSTPTLRPHLRLTRSMPIQHVECMPS